MKIASLRSIRLWEEKWQYQDYSCNQMLLTCFLSQLVNRLPSMQYERNEM